MWNIAFLSSTVPHLPPLVGLIQQLQVEEEQMMTMMMFSSFAIRKKQNNGFVVEVPGTRLHNVSFPDSNLFVVS